MVQKPTKGQIGWALVTFATMLAVLFFGVTYPIPEPPAEDTFSVQLSREFAVDYLKVKHEATFDGGLTVNGPFEMAAQTPISVTNNLTIAATGSVVPIRSAGAVGTNKVIGCEEMGRVTYLVNVGAQTITITETTGLVMAGNWAAGAGDTLTFLGDGNACYEVARSNN